jgi:hypothetical protein
MRHIPYIHYTCQRLGKKKKKIKSFLRLFLRDYNDKIV